MIRVPCVCGKTYRVPPTKAGRKLQCRRCGATQRIPHPEPEDDELLVPFEVLESDEGPLDPPPSRAPELELAPRDDELDDLEPQPRRRKKRRGPKTGKKRQNKRKGRRKRDPSGSGLAQEPEVPELAGPERSALRVLARLARASWWALTPAGLVWGPYVALQARGLEARLGNAVKARSQLHQVVLTSWTGALLWALVAVFGSLRLAAALPDSPAAEGHDEAVANSGGAGQGTEEIRPPRKGVAPPTEGLREAQGEPFPLRRFLVLAWAADADPGAAIDAESLSERVGEPLEKALARALTHADSGVRGQALRIAKRAGVGLTQGQTRKLRNDPDYAVRRAAAAYLRKGGDPAWAKTLLSVAGSGANLHAALAREDLLKSTGDRETALLILRGASDVRETQGRTEHEPLLVWPQASLPNAVAHLADAEARAEAYAVLHYGAASSITPLLDGAASTNAQTAGAALDLLAVLTGEGVCPLRTFLDAVATNTNPTCQASAMQAFTSSIEAPGAELTAWILGILRTQPESRLAHQLAPLLATVGVAPGTDVGWLVQDLTQAGDTTALLRELHSARRAGDPQLDKALRRVWKNLRGTPLKLRVLALAHARLFPESLDLLLEGLEDRDATVRAEAARLLGQQRAPEPDAFRKKAAQTIAARLRNERDEGVRDSLYHLATGGRFGWLKDQRKNPSYALSNSLREALKQSIRKGSAKAVRALASHPTEKTLKVLIELLDRTRDGSLRLQLLSALNSLSGYRKATSDANHWKESLQPLPPSVEEVLTQMAAQDLRTRNAVRERATARLSEAQQAFAELRASAGQR